MAIEGPLRELGIHDVFQLLDLSRKTGTLRVRSALRENEGTVWFEKGHVIAATMRSNPHRLGQLLIRAGKITEAQLEQARALQAESGDRVRLGEVLVTIGAITQRELERHVRQQVETVVFEMMSWEEGFFSFSDRNVRDATVDGTVRISTESLLMEGARRLDEWARIAHRIPHVGVVPTLAAADGDHPSSLELLPKEWEVLAAIDGTADLRAIASRLGRSEFDVAKVGYGLLSTGVIDVLDPRAEPGQHGSVVMVDLPVPASRLMLARDAAMNGQFGEAREEWERFLAESPNDVRVSRVRELVACAARMQALLGSVDDE